MQPPAGPPPTPLVTRDSCWDSDLWSYRQHAGLQFATVEELDAAIDLLWNDAQLWGLPRVHVGDNTMIVPAAAVELFKQKGCKFTVKAVVSAGDLPAEEVNRLRRGG